MAIPDENTLHVLFGQSPDLAIKYLTDKELLPSKHWYDILDHAHNKSFVVANLARIDILNDIKQSLIDAQKKGLTLEQWQKNIVPTLQAKGWWGKDIDNKELGTPHRMQTIYRTNLQAAYMAGRRAEMLQAVDTHPYWRYVAVMDNRTRPAHRALNGVVMPADDSAWDSIFPPNAFNCRCRVSPMTAGAVERGGYTVESSEGFVESVAVGVGDHKTSATITQVNLPSMGMPFKTDVGFNYAPNVGTTSQLIAKTQPDIVRKLPEHPLFNPSQATVDDFVKLGRQRLNDVLLMPATDAMTMRQVFDLVGLDDYGEYHPKLNQWIVRELERTRQAGTVAANVQGGHQAKKLMSEATRGYPADWVKAANQYGTLYIKYSKQRGWAVTIPKDGLYDLKQFGVIQAVKGDGYIVAARHGTAVHEFAHRIQAVRPDLDDLFQQEHRQRTLHDAVQQLADSPRGEVGKADGYYTPYMGRHYKRADGREALELMTMAFEPILGHDVLSARKMFKMYHKDQRMLELALGILFHAK